MTAHRETLISWQRRVAALQAPACGMAHEAIRFGSDAMPVGDPSSSTGYARADICPVALRSGHVGCTHTVARHALRDALRAIPGGGDEVLLRELVDFEGAIGRLDHRRYNAETRRARAVEGGTAAETAAAERPSMISSPNTAFTRPARWLCVTPFWRGSTRRSSRRMRLSTSGSWAWSAAAQRPDD